MLSFYLTIFFFFLIFNFFFLISCDCGDDDCKHGETAAKIGAICDLIFECFQFLLSNFNPHSKDSFKGK